MKLTSCICAQIFTPTEYDSKFAFYCKSKNLDEYDTNEIVERRIMKLKYVTEILTYGGFVICCDLDTSNIATANRRLKALTQKVNRLLERYT